MGEKVYEFAYMNGERYMTLTKFFLKLLLPVSGSTVFSWVHRLGSRLVS